MSKYELGSFSDVQIETIDGLRVSAREEVNQAYGVGYPTYEGCEDLWFYHNGWHTGTTEKDSRKTGAATGLGRDALVLVGLAAAEHDNGQGKGHEERNAERVMERLRRKGFSEPVATVTGLAICATGTVIENGVLVGQIVTQLEYPSREAEKIAFSVASGDLSVLWTPEGPLQMYNLFREICHDKTPPLDNKFIQFLEKQMQMLTTYQYPLPEAKRVLATHHREVMLYHEYVLGQLHRGELESWGQLYAQTVTFSRYPDDWYTRI